MNDFRKASDQALISFHKFIHLIFVSGQDYYQLISVPVLGKIIDHFNNSILPVCPVGQFISFINKQNPF